MRKLPCLSQGSNCLGLCGPLLAADKACWGPRWLFGGGVEIASWVATGCWAMKVFVAGERRSATHEPHDRGPRDAAPLTTPTTTATLYSFFPSNSLPLASPAPRLLSPLLWTRSVLRGRGGVNYTVAAREDIKSRMHGIVAEMRNEHRNELVHLVMKTAVITTVHSRKRVGDSVSSGTFRCFLPLYFVSHHHPFFHLITMFHG